MSTALANTAEGGTAGATPTSSDTGSGNAYDTVLINSGTAITYDTTHPVHGTKSYKYVTGTNNLLVCQKWNTSLTAAGLGFLRRYVYLTAYPTVALGIAKWVDVSGNAVGYLKISNAGALSWNDQNGVQQAVCSTKIPLNTKVRIEGSIVSSAAAGTGSCSLFLTDPDSTTPDETHSVSGQATNGNNITEVWVGKCTTNATGNISFWVDDDAVSTLAAIGPSATVTAPGAATSLVATAGDGSITLTYTAGSTGGGMVTDTVTPFIAGVAQPSLAVPGSPGGTHIGGVTNGVTYTLKVTSTNAAGSATSVASSAVTPTAGTFFFRVGFIPLSPGTIITPPPPPPGGTLINGIGAGNTQAQWNAFSSATNGKITAYRGYDGNQPATFAASVPGRIVGPKSWLLSVKPPYLSSGTVAPTNAWKSQVAGWAATVPNFSRVCAHHEPENDGRTPAIWANTVKCWQDAVRGANPTLLTGIITVANSGSDAAYLQAAVDAGLTPDFYYCDGYSGIPPSTNPPYPSPSTVFASYLSLHSTYFPSALKGCGEWGQNVKQGDRSPYIVAFWSFAKKNGLAEVYYFQPTAPYALTTQKEFDTLAGLG